MLQVCRDREHQAVNADCRSTPLRDGIAEGVICIAVIHHLATESRRLQAIQDISRNKTKNKLEVFGQVLFVSIYYRASR